MTDPTTISFLDRIAWLYWLALVFLASGALWFIGRMVVDLFRISWRVVRWAWHTVISARRSRADTCPLPRYEAFARKLP